MSPVNETAKTIKAALLAAEQAHPNSTALYELHKVLKNALDEHGESIGLLPAQVQSLGGGTNKTPPNDA